MFKLVMKIPTNFFLQNLLEGPLAIETTQNQSRRKDHGLHVRNDTGRIVSKGGKRESKKTQGKQRQTAAMRNLRPRPIAPRPAPSPIQDGAQFWGGLAKKNVTRINPDAPEDQLNIRRTALSGKLLVSNKTMSFIDNISM